MKKLELTQEQFEILLKLNNVKNFISNFSKKTEYKNNGVVYSEYCIIEVKDISGFQDEIYFNIVENGMDKNGKVNEYGKKVYDLYDAILTQL